MDLANLISKKRILVVGDSILDEYIYGKVYRISPEAPVPVVLKSNRSYCLGGASNVAQNIISMGASCDLISIIGKDHAGDKLSSLCKDIGINLIGLDDGRSTTVKSRVIGNGHQIVRIDEESTFPISEHIENCLIELVNSASHLVDGVIIQDYGKGLVTKRVVDHINSLFSKKLVPVLVDPKDNDISKYSGSHIIKPNLSEFKNFLGVDQNIKLSGNDIKNRAMDLMLNNSVGSLLITLSEKGMVYVKDDLFVTDRGVKIDITDVSGAGDTVSAVFMLFYLAGMPISDCLRASNLAGSQVCKISGAVPVNLNLLIADFNAG